LTPLKEFLLSITSKTLVLLLMLTRKRAGVVFSERTSHVKFLLLCLGPAHALFLFKSCKHTYGNFQVETSNLVLKITRYDRPLQNQPLSASIYAHINQCCDQGSSFRDRGQDRGSRVRDRGQDRGRRVRDRGQDLGRRVRDRGRGTRQLVNILTVLFSLTWRLLT